MVRRKVSKPAPSASALSSAEKAVALDALNKSVVEPSEETGVPASAQIIWIARMADGMEPWGSSPKLRDKQLREFFPTENFLISALGVVCSRNAAFSWSLDGPGRTVNLYQDILLNANLGEGWVSFMVKLSMDLYTQDSGAFVELIRQDDSPMSPVVGINHLDAGRCYPTGNPENPVIYMDRLGKLHAMKPHQIVNIHEMPSAIEHPAFGPLYTLQYCAVTRLLRAAQILRNTAIYKEEKTGGRFERAIHLVKGITAKQINDALAQQATKADLRGLLRYIQPLVVTSVSPTADIGHETIELATLPDSWNEKEQFELYITAIAMAFLSDYQEFAPLPGGNLGTSAQSYILHMKSRGKGPGLFMKLISHLMNFQGVLPKNVQFKWSEMDVEAEQAQAEISKLRADERAVRIQSTELTPAAARQIARDIGDLSPELFTALGGSDITPNVTLEDEEKPEVPQPPGAVQPALPAPPAPSQPASPPPQAPAEKPVVGAKDLQTLLGETDGLIAEIEESLKASEEHRAGPEEVEADRLAVEDMVKEQALKALRKMQKRIRARLEAEV